MGKIRQLIYKKPKPDIGWPTVATASKAYPDLWHRYICLIYGVDTPPKNILLTQQQADQFISLTKLDEFQ